MVMHCITLDLFLVSRHATSSFKASVHICFQRQTSPSGLWDLKDQRTLGADSAASKEEKKAREIEKPIKDQCVI